MLNQIQDLKAQIDTLKKTNINELNFNNNQDNLK